MIFNFIDAADDLVFLRNKIDLEDKTLAADKSALTVDINFPVLKVQFLFTFLNSLNYLNKDYFHLLSCIIYLI